MKARTLKKNKVNVVTLGCSKNIFDSEVLMAQLKANGMEVDHAEHAVGFVLDVDPIAKRAEVVAEMDLTGRLDAGEHTGHGRSG